MTTTATRSELEESTPPKTRRAATTAVVSDAAGAVKVAAEDAAAKLPGVAATGRSMFDDANRRIQASTDEMLRLGTAVSFGFAAGLLVGGANRLLVGAAFVPVAMMGLTLLDRAAGRPAMGSTKGPGGL